MSLLQNSNAISTGGGYNLESSLRFRSVATAYLSRTPATASNQKTYTYSTWVKRGALGSLQLLLHAANSSGQDYTILWFQSTDELKFFTSVGNVARADLVTTMKFRDPSAWYHIVLATDTTQATASNRVKMYVNGEQITAFSSSTYPNLNEEAKINSTEVHKIGANVNTNFQPFDGYMTEVNFVDGQALTPSDFGEYDDTTGVWKPKRYAGTYGTNGFYLNFSDATSTTTLGYDQSSNSNNWTVNNISLTAGTTYDLMNDVPTLTDEDTANYCVLNPLNTILPLSGANLIGTQSTAAWTSSSGTIAASSGKYYYEASMSTIGGGNYIALGLMLTGTAFNQYAGSNTNSWSVLTNSTNLSTYFNAAATNATTISATSSTAFQVAVDIDAGKLWLGYNNNWLGGGNPATGTSPTYTFTANSLVNPIISGYSNIVHLNCGQRPFAYTPPTGFKKLNTYNLPDSTIKDGSQYFDVSTWTGNGGTQDISLEFSPDLVWAKDRSAVAIHMLSNTISGPLKSLSSNDTTAEASNDAIRSFNSNGFTTGTWVNTSSNAFVGWSWRGSDSSAVSNTDGTITSTVSANTTSGFSVVTYTDSSSGGTIGHGLSQAPEFIISKLRNTTSNWIVLTTAVDGSVDYCILDGTVQTANAGQTITSTTFDSPFFANNTAVSYCFHSVEGFSKFGSYTGNGSSDGAFTYLGFKPSFVMIKRADAADAWVMFDSERGSYNLNTPHLQAHLSSAEANVSTYGMDFLSNGFKCRASDTSMNTSGGTYIYMAFAENPFKHSLAR